MPIIKWNYINLSGNNNLIIQDAEGNSLQISIDVFIKQFTKEKDEVIKLLEGQIMDKTQINELNKEKILALLDELNQVKEAKEKLQGNINSLIKEFVNKDITSTNSLYQEAFNYFINGSINLALDSLSDFKLQDQLDEIQNQEEKNTKAKKKLAEAYALKGKMLLMKYDFSNAIENCQKAVYLDANNSDFWIDLDDCYLEYGNLIEAKKCFAKSVELEKFDKYHTNGRSHLQYAIALMELAEYQAAYEALNQAREIAEYEQSDLIINVFSRLAKLSYIFGNSEDQILFDTAAYNIGKTVYNKNEKLTSLANNVGVAYYNNEQYNLALEYFEESLQIHKEIYNSDIQIGGLLFFNLGCVNHCLGNLDNALELTYKAIDIDSKLLPEDHIQLATYYHSIGPLLSKKGDKNKAIGYLLKSLKIKQKTYPFTHLEIAGGYAALAVMLQTTHTKFSILFFTKAIKIREEIFGLDDIEVAKWYLLLSVSYGFLKETLRSLFFHEEAWLRLNLQKKEVKFDQMSQKHLFLDDFEKHLKNTNIILSKSFFEKFSSFKFLITTWEGTYSYSLDEGQKQTGFRMFFRATSCDNLAGTCLEYKGENENPKIARIQGSFSRDLNIKFEKNYIYLTSAVSENVPSFTSKILYDGVFLENEERFVGTWKILQESNRNIIHSSGFWQMKKL